MLVKIYPIIQRAIRCYFEAMNEDSNFLSSRFHAALMLQKICNYSEALKQLGILVEVLPDDKTIWIQRGLVYQELHEHQLAIEDFAEAIDIDPCCATAMFHMATSRLKAGQIAQAISDF